MHKTFNADKKNYNATVIGCVQLHEAAPSASQIATLRSLGIKKEQVAGRRIGGIVCIIAAVLLTVGAIALIGFLPGIRMGNYEVTFIPYFLFFPALGVLIAGINLFRRKIATKPETAFKRLWGQALCTAPDYVADAAVTFREHIFNIPENAAKALAAGYPFENAQVPLQMVHWFMGGVKPMVMRCFEQYGTPLNGAPHYAVNYDKNPALTPQPNGVSLIQGKVNIIRCLPAEKHNAECVELSVSMYFVQVGQYWIPANLVPYFTQLTQPQTSAVQPATLAQSPGYGLLTQ